MAELLYVIHLSFKLDIEYVQKDFLKVGNAIGGWCKPIMHGKATVGYVFVSKELIEVVEARLRPALEGIDMLSNWWLCPAPTTIRAKHGGIDPSNPVLLEGWNRIGERRHSQYMRQPQRWQTCVEGTVDNL